MVTGKTRDPNEQNIYKIQDHYKVIENAYKSWNKRSTKCLHADGSWAPGRIFSYCVLARAYTHVLARVYSTRASTCTIYTCFTLPHTRVNLTGLQL